MVKPKSKNQLLQRNEQILTEMIPKYLKEVQDNNKMLEKELNEWTTITTKANNPYNMKQYLNKLNKELNEWRTLIPGKKTIVAAKKHLNKHSLHTINFVPDQKDIDDMHLYNTDFIEAYGPQYRITQTFDNVNDFMNAKSKAIDNITNEDIDMVTKLVHDRFFFTRFFEYKRDNNIPDHDFDVNTIGQYTKW